MDISAKKILCKLSFRIVVMLALAFGLSAGKAQATHIMGGSFTYELTPAGDYNLQLLLYFDMVNGSPGAMDPSTSVTVFDAGTQQAITTLSLPLTSTAPDTCNTGCGLCVTKLFYTLNNVQLTVPAAGLKLVFERCCRSNVIQNIPDPGSRGLFISTTIPALPNTSAVFTSPVPPVFLAFAANTFDASATDADGDELTYRLDDLYYGSATATNPIPAQNASFSSIGPWSAGYSTGNMLGSTQPLQIDANTGHITVTPTTLGVFQIAYVVEERRNGQLISATRNEILVAACMTSATSPEIKTEVLQLYPNPTIGLFTLNLSGIEKYQPIHIEIFNLLGQPVLTQTFFGNQPTEIDMRGFSDGSYVVRSRINDRIVTQQVILQR